MAPAGLNGKVLITGASGFIGSRLRDTLLDSGSDVLAIRRKGSPPAKRGRSVEADYADLRGITEIVADEKPDFVLHVAGATKGVTYDDFWRANVLPTQTLVRAFEVAHPALTRFVHVSSLVSYGPSTKTRPHVESDLPKPIEFYGRSKHEAELEVAKAKQLDWTILNPAGVYGPGDVDYFELFKEASHGRNIFFGNRQRWFSALYVDDMVSAILHVANHPDTKRARYFVCDDRPVTWQSFQKEIVEASGRRVIELDLPEFLTKVAAFGGELATRFDGKARLFNHQKVKMGVQDAWTCTSKSLRATGWSSEYDLERGVAAATEWYRQNGWIR